jgi:hypothetical protein
MMDHLYSCTYLPKGSVECLDCQKITKIGRFHASDEDCNETPSCKNRITTALSPLLDHFWPPSSPRSESGHVRKDSSNALQQENKEPTFVTSSLPSELLEFQPPNRNEHGNSHPSELYGVQILELETPTTNCELEAPSTAEARAPIHAMTMPQQKPLAQTAVNNLWVSQTIPEASSLEIFLANGAGATISPFAQQSRISSEHCAGMRFYPAADTPLLYGGSYNSNGSGFVASTSIPNSKSSSPTEQWTPSTEYSSNFDIMGTCPTTNGQQFSSVDNLPISYNFDKNTEKHTVRSAAYGAPSHTNNMDGMSFLWSPATEASYNRAQFPVVEEDLSQDMVTSD